MGSERMTNKTSRTLAEIIRDYREQHLLTQEALAFKSGVTIATVSRLERGFHHLSWTTTRAIATALDMSTADIAVAIDASCERIASTAGASDPPRRRRRSEGSPEPATARVVLACVPLTPQAAIGVEAIAREAEIAPSIARRCLAALLIAGDVLRAHGEPIRYYLSEQGDQRARQEAQRGAEPQR